MFSSSHEVARINTVPPTVLTTIRGTSLLLNKNNKGRKDKKILALEVIEKS